MVSLSRLDANGPFGGGEVFTYGQWLGRVDPALVDSPGHSRKPGLSEAEVGLQFHRRADRLQLVLARILATSCSPARR